MTDPVTHCLRKLDHASGVTAAGASALVTEALDELESAYGRASERIVALEAVLHDYDDRVSHRRGTPFHRFLVTAIDRRQGRLVEGRLIEGDRSTKRAGRPLAAIRHG
ncbi:hypothetical protein M446_2018 [Methylobacterium sp. 4-46]|uniref:hypothetical protein n=1 Tax=unclassified Methylobacterium TaxID=2615210 RepID=UPI000152DF6A|nr:MULTISPECIES: hypothetical protein [Methylobacterium]ACA16482.1 hypothetical protein M446_2018 [Methylobacterium sp. 4-46]WFT82192.1 hypothetical protein QA634_10230 [Methylobacterium nodulans]